MAVKTNKIAGLLLTNFVLLNAITVQGTDTIEKPQPPVVGSHAAAILDGITTPVLNPTPAKPVAHHSKFILRTDTTGNVTLRDIAQDFLSLCKSVGSLCGNTFLFFAQYKLAAAAIFIGMFLTNAIGSAVRRVLRSK
jgi:hypothetical protein